MLLQNEQAVLVLEHLHVVSVAIPLGPSVCQSRMLSRISERIKPCGKVPVFHLTNS